MRSGNPLKTSESEALKMVNLLIGHKGSGKTKKIIELANNKVQTADRSIIFINKNHCTRNGKDYSKRL